MKYAWIDAYRDEYSVSRLCRVLGVSRSGYCQWRSRAPSPRSQARLDIVDWIAGYYNRQRLHYSAGYVTPVHAEEALLAA